MTNPFYSDSDDDDILKDEVPQTSNSGDKSGVTGFLVHGVAGKEVPQQLVNSIQKHMGMGAPQIAGKTTTPEIFGLVSHIFVYLSRINFSGESGCMTLAMQDLEVNVDTTNMTKAERIKTLEDLIMIRIAEKKVLHAHDVLKFCNSLVTMEKPIPNNLDDHLHWSEIITYIQLVADFETFILAHYQNVYRTLCAEYKMDIDEHMLDTGTKSVRSKFEAYSWRPKAEAEA